MPAGRIYTPAPVSDHPLNRGLVAWWLGLPDLSGGPRLYDLLGLTHGDLTNGPAWAPGPGGFGAVDLDASDDVVAAADADALDPPALTAACRVRVRSYAGNAYQVLFGKANGAWDQGWGLVAHPESGGRVGLWVNSYSSGGRAYADRATYLPANTWVHLAGTYDGATARFYADGVERASAAYATGLTPSAAPLRAGYVSGLAPLDGAFGDARVYSRALPAAEVWGLYDQSRRGHPDTLRRVRSRAWAFGAGGVPPATNRRRRALIAGGVS